MHSYQPACDLNTSWKSSSVKVAAILPRSHHLYQNGGLSVVSSIGETEKSRVRVGGDDSHVAFGQQFLDEERSVRQSNVVIQHSVPFSQKFGAMSSHIFTQSP
jgi:hypothetical protein